MKALYLTLFLGLSTAVGWAAPGPKEAAGEEAAPQAEDAPEAGLVPELGDPKPKAPGYLGVTGEDLAKGRAQELKLESGVTLLSVQPGTPAAKADLKVGDVITQVDQDRVASMQDLIKAMQARKEGDEVTLKVARDDQRLEKKVTLAARPAPVILPQAGLNLQVFPGAQMNGGMRLNFAGGGGVLRMGDAEGSVELKGEGEGREVVVRDQQGEIIFEGPWVTPQDMAAAPPDIKQRIDRINTIFGGNLDFEPPRVRPALPRLPVLPPPRPARPAPEPALPQEDIPEPGDPPGDPE